MASDFSKATLGPTEQWNNEDHIQLAFHSQTIIPMWGYNKYILKQDEIITSRALFSQGPFFGAKQEKS